MAGTQLIERKQKMNCQLWQNLLNCFYWWARAKNSSFYFRALIFCEEKKDLIAIETFYSRERSFLKQFVQCNRSLVFKYQRDFSFSQKINAIKIKLLLE
jgi:hypothetical protein